MRNQVVRAVTILLGLAGIVAILAGPAFHLIDAKLALFGGIVSFLVAGAVSAIFKKKEKKK